MNKRDDSHVQIVENAIIVLRGHRAILDADLARMYGVEVRALVQAVKRNIARFPADFMFRLTREESQWRSRSQSVILNAEVSANAGVLGVRAGLLGRGKNLKHLPYAFTEQGVAMLSSVLRSPQAVQVNIEIMRAFVRLRQLLHGHAALAKKVDDLEKRYDGQFRIVFNAIRELMTESPASERPIGFRGA